MSYIRIEPNPKALRLFSSFFDVAVMRIATFCAFTAIVLKNPSYGGFRLFCCFVGVNLCVEIANALTKRVIAASANIDTSHAKEQIIALIKLGNTLDPNNKAEVPSCTPRTEQFKEIAGIRSSQMEWFFEAAVLISFCVGLDQLAKAGKFDMELSTTAIKFIASIIGVVLVLTSYRLLAGNSQPELSTINSVVAGVRMPSQEV